MELVGFFIGAALVAWLNTYLAEQRGRSVTGWAIGGVIFGLFSTILLLVLGTTAEKLTNNAIAINKALNK